MSGTKNINITKSALLISAITLIGKLLGFIRQTVIANYFGVSWQTDAFFFAEKMPKLIFPSIANAIATAFITIYISKSVVESKTQADRFASSVLVAMMIAAILLSGIGVVICPVLVKLLAPGFFGEQLSLAVHLTRITLGAYVLSVAQYMLAAILNSKKIFVRSQIGGLFYNVFVIIQTLILGQNQGVDNLVWTIVSGQIIQVIVVLFFVSKNFKFTWHSSSVFHDGQLIIILAVPIFVSGGLESLNQLVDELLGSLLSTGTISGLSYSSSLNSIVTGMFISALSTVLYPILTENVANGQTEEFSNNLRKNLLVLFIVLIPVSVIACFCAPDIVSVVYKRGNFNKEAVELTTKALAYYAWMYPFLAIQNVAIRGFYAIQDTKTPLYMSGIAVLLNSVFSYFLSKKLAIGGLALGTTISAFLSAFFLLLGLRKKISSISLWICIPSAFKAIIAGVIMSVCIIILNPICGTLSHLTRLILVSSAGGTSYIAILIVLKCSEVFLLKKKVLRKTSIQ